MDAQRADKIHLAPRPRRQGIGHARSQLRRIGKHPRQDREIGDEKGTEAEQKPFPRDLARLHLVPATRSRRWPINLDLACFSIARKTPSFLARLGRDSEPKSGAFCWQIRTREGHIRGVSPPRLAGWLKPLVGFPR